MSWKKTPFFTSLLPPRQRLIVLALYIEMNKTNFFFSNKCFRTNFPDVKEFIQKFSKSLKIINISADI
jgi:hypothetical protein